MSALFYHLTHLFLEKVVVGDNFYNGVMAGGFAGFIFRSPKGLKRAMYGIIPGMIIGIGMEMHDKRQLRKFKWRDTLEYAKRSTPFLNKLEAPQQPPLKKNQFGLELESIEDSVEGYGEDTHKME